MSASMNTLVDINHLILTGTEHANYVAIDNGQFPRLPEYEIVLKEITLSAGLKAYFSVDVKWTRTNRERELEPIDQSRDDEGWNGEMKDLGQEYAILFDTAARRAWLVNGQSVLLHLLRASLENDRDQLSSYLNTPDPGDSSTEETAAGPNLVNMVTAQGSPPAAAVVTTQAIGSQSGPAFVLTELNKIARCYQDRSGSLLKSDAFRKFRKLTLSERDTIKDADDETQANAVYVERRLIKLLEGLWKMSRKGEVHSSEPKTLEGYDFWDLARCRSPLSAKAVKLSAVAEGWIEFTRSLPAITLFASGFGTLLRPDCAEGHVCSHCLWNREAPAGQDILAMSMADLEHLHRPEWRSSDPGERIVKGKFPWPQPAGCFTPCTRRSAKACSRTIRIQTFKNPPKDVSKRLLKSPLLKFHLSLTKREGPETTGEVKRTGALLLGDSDHWKSKSANVFLAVSKAGSNSDASHPSDSTGRDRPNMLSLTPTIDNRSRAASASEASNVQPSSMIISASGSSVTTAIEASGMDVPSAGDSHTAGSLYATARPTSDAAGHPSSHSTPHVVVSPSNPSTGTVPAGQQPVNYTRLMTLQ